MEGSHAMALWMACAIAALAYYAMYAGVGVQYKTTDVTPRVIFWARYVDRFITTPLLLCALAAFAKAEFPVLVSLIGADMIMMSCLALGAFVAGPDKFVVEACLQQASRHPLGRKSIRFEPSLSAPSVASVQTLNGKCCVAWTVVVAVRAGCRIAINPYLHGRVSLHVCHYARRVSAPRQGVVVGMVGQM